MKFLHISDLHKLLDYRGKGGKYNGVISRMKDPFVQLDELLRDSEDRFDFVIVSGDICEYGEVEDYLFVKEKLEQTFSCPIFVCSGNHDNREKLIEAFQKKKTEGELFEQIQLEGVRIIFFDSSDPMYNDGFVSEKTCDLLEEALNRKCDVPTILVSHHHLLDEQFAMPKAQYPSRLKEIIANGDIAAILTGHTHHIFHGTFMGKPYHTSGSLSFVGEECDGKLFFYEQPSAIVFTLKDGVLDYRDLHSSAEKRILEVWDQEA